MLSDPEDKYNRRKYWDNEGQAGLQLEGITVFAARVEGCFLLRAPV